MADKTETKSLAPADTKPAAEGASQILKQGEAPEPPPAAPQIAPAGPYKVTHGTISFGNGQIAYTGAIVSLSAAEASMMLPLGVIEAT